MLAGVYMVAEFVGGWLTNSLALLADAGHMLSDVAALSLTVFAAWIAARPAPAHRTYGYYRAEILAALANGAALIALSGWILFQAATRFLTQSPEVGREMLWIACGGLAVNLISLWLLHAGRDGNLNVRGAWLHVLSDALGSVATIVAGALVWTLKWHWADAAASAVIALLVIHASWRLLAEAVSVLMESAPRGIDVDDVRAAMAETSGVAEVHDLHVWSITTGLDALSAHVVLRDGHTGPQVLTDLRQTLHQRFGIDHITIQIEPPEFCH